MQLQLVEEVPEVLPLEKVKLGVVRKPSVLPVLLPEQAQSESFALQEIEHADHDPFFLDLLDADEHVMAISDLHALSMYDVVVLRVFRVEAELQFLETCQIIELEDQRGRLRRLLDEEPHVGDVADFLNATVRSLIAFV